MANRHIIRRYETSYAGARSGYSNTRESAINAAIGHIVRDGYTAATITDRKTLEDVAWIKLADNKRSVLITTAHNIKKVTR